MNKKKGRRMTSSNKEEKREQNKCEESRDIKQLKKSNSEDE